MLKLFAAAAVLGSLAMPVTAEAFTYPMKTECMPLDQLINAAKMAFGEKLIWHSDAAMPGNHFVVFESMSHTYTAALVLAEPVDGKVMACIVGFSSISHL